MCCQALKVRVLHIAPDAVLDNRESSGLENHRPLRDCRFESYTQRQMADWCNGNITVSSAVEDGSTPSSATIREVDIHGL